MRWGREGTTSTAAAVQMALRSNQRSTGAQGIKTKHGTVHDPVQTLIAADLGTPKQETDQIETNPSPSR